MRMSRRRSRFSILRVLKFDTAARRVGSPAAGHYSRPVHSARQAFPEELMKAMTSIVAALAVAYCCQAHAEQEFQITPRLGFGEIRLDPGVLTVDNADVDDDDEVDTVDAGVGLSYVTPFALMLEVGLQYQTNVAFGPFDDLSFEERYAAVGIQLEFGSGFRFTPKVGRTRWRLRNEEGIFLNPGPEEIEVFDGYEDFWEVSLTKTIAESISMGARYKSADYSFGEVSSLMFVTTFGFR
jgi:hypothetical protein